MVGGKETAIRRVMALHNLRFLSYEYKATDVHTNAIVRARHRHFALVFTTDRPDIDASFSSRIPMKSDKTDTTESGRTPQNPSGKQRRASATRRRNRKPADQGRTALRQIDPSLYINRELSWLEFNHRVLEEALDERHPLLERAKFLAIVSSNLDEFFMIRVAAIKEQILADVVEYTPDGRTPLQQLGEIHARVVEMVKRMSDCFWNDLHPKLAANGIHLLTMRQVSTAERAGLTALFAKEIFPVLTPLAFDPGHPFPYLSNLSLSLAVVVSSPKGEERFARVKVPDVLPRLVEIPGGDGREFRFVWLEDLIADNLGMLFPGMAIKESYAFRITRNADIEIEEDEAEDLIRTIAESLQLRRFGSVVRLGIQKTMPARIKNILVENLEITRDDVYALTPPLGLGHLMALLKIPRPELKDPVFTPASLQPEEEGDDMFTIIKRCDVLLHHPYDSFNPVVQFIKNAVNDPAVLAIKQTLYRIGKESPLIPLLIQAAEEGKQVAVLVELKARFDEENNIEWAKKLEHAGVHVVYGLMGLKTHAKVALVVRKEQDGLKRYVHLGTGNYNPVTARIYTDLSYFTCREDITNDATELFNFLTGYSHRESYSKLIVAPVNMREKLTALIQREMTHAKQGRKAEVIFKTNALTDLQMIETLYEASKAGVSINLIVRGICCLRPGIKGVSENIKVRSIVGRFLEHSRVYYFANDGNPELLLGSADLMGRNLDRRVELLFPIEDKTLREMVVREVLELQLQDTRRARILTGEGLYTRPAEGPGEPLEAQSATILSRTKPAVKVVPRDSAEKASP
jgi:polyphosphate kinase